jgi:alpha-1,2-rhamnosyltransferase
MRIFLECTATYQFDGNTGIQRVVRNIVNTSAVVGLELGLCCQPIVYEKDLGFCPISGLTPPDPNQKPTFGQYIRRVLSPSLQRMGLLGAVQGVLKLSRAVGRRFRRQLTTQELPEPVTFQAGDVILLMDSSWTTPYWRDLEQAQQQGARVGFLIYDLIPMLHPDVTNLLILAAFPKWWRQVCQKADFLQCISRTVSQDVLSWIKEQGVPERSKPLDCGWFHLGHDLDGCRAEDGIRPDFEKLFAGDDGPPTYLMVGSINPRKNHMLALDAFDRLWAEGLDARLVIIGNIGWTTDEFERRVKKHPERNRRLHWHTRVSDADLEHAYQHARALITASIAEGFNLPIVEALQRGCPVYASDFPVHREVGGSHAVYFSTDSADGLYHLLRDDCQASGSVNRYLAAGFTWPNWQASCRQLLTNLQAPSGGQKSKAA